MLTGKPEFCWLQTEPSEILDQFWSVRSPERCWAEQSHYLGDVGDKVLAEGQAAADEPHGDHVVGQANDVLVKPAAAETPTAQCALLSLAH